MNTETMGQVPEWSITDRLRKARELTDLDQDEFAELIGVSRGTVSNYERGTDTHKRPYLLAWAIGSGVSYEWLVTGRELEMMRQT
jgi:transcriptional regulator with XRE-family HTH domain